MTANGTKEDWSNLVTDGHVRAARLRFMQPWLIGIGAASLIVGFYLWSGVTPPEPARTSTSASSEVQTAQAPIQAALAGLPTVNVPTETARQLPNAAELGQVIKLALDGLTKNNQLPADLAAQQLSPDHFWRDAWPNGTLVVTGNDDLKVVGGIVNTSPPDGWPNASRWLGIFSKRNGSWRYATAQWPGFVSVADQPDVPPLDIPLTLAPAVPEAK